MIILKVRSKARITSSKWHIMMKHYLSYLHYLCNLALGPDLSYSCSLRQVALILQMAAIGFWESLPTAARWSVNMFIYPCLLNDKFVMPCLFHAIRKIPMVGCCITFGLRRRPHVIRHPTMIDIFPYYVNKQGITKNIPQLNLQVTCTIWLSLITIRQHTLGYFHTFDVTRTICCNLF